MTIDRIAMDTDPPVFGQCVHTPAVFGLERDVSTFALPGLAGGVHPRVRDVPHPRLLVRPVADGGEVLGAVVGPGLHGPEVAQLVPLAAVLTADQAVADPAVAEFAVGRRGRGAAHRVLPVEPAGAFAG